MRQPDLIVDAHSLEPPQPMVKILDALSQLPRGSMLLAHTDRRPVQLYAVLEHHGFVGITEPQPDGGFVTHIRHA